MDMCGVWVWYLAANDAKGRNRHWCVTPGTEHASERRPLRRYADVVVGVKNVKRLKYVVETESEARDCEDCTALGAVVTSLCWPGEVIQ